MIPASQRKMILEQAARNAQMQAEHDAMILAALADGTEKAVKEIARDMPFSIQRIQHRMVALLERNAVHISRTWSSTKFYKTGPQTAPALTVADRILIALADGPATMEQLADKLGMSRAHICETINTSLFHGANRKVYVCKYNKTGHMKKQRQRVFALGNRPDVPRPARQSMAVIQRRSKAKRRKDDEVFIAEHAKRVARGIKPKADPFLSQFAGLFGQRQAA